MYLSMHNGRDEGRLGRDQASCQLAQARSRFCRRAGITWTIEDRRFEYGERRYITLGMLRDTVVVMAHAETPATFRVISMRKATRREQILYFQNI